MKISPCTISFRHHLLSIRAIARLAQGYGFDGIELWGTITASGTTSRFQFSFGIGLPGAM